MEEIFIPALGMAMEEATLVEWLKQPGDAIEAGDNVAVIETDKATMELSATGAGTLGRQRFSAGVMVPVGMTVTVILAPGETDPGDGEPSTDSAAVPADAEPIAAAQDVAIAVAEPADESKDAAPPSRLPHKLSPRQRRLAAEAAADAGTPVAAKHATPEPVSKPSPAAQRRADSNRDRPLAGLETLRLCRSSWSPLSRLGN